MIIDLDFYLFLKDHYISFSQYPWDPAQDNDFYQKEWPKLAQVILDLASSERGWAKPLWAKYS